MILNNREIATFLWIIIIALLFLIHPKFKSTGIQVVKSFLHWKIISNIVLINLYIFFIVNQFQKFNLWDYNLLKDTIYFSLFTSTYILFKASTSNEPEKILLELLIDTIKFTVFIEFIVNYSTNSLFFEILIIPVVVFLTVMATVSEKKYKTLHIMFNFILISLQFYLLTLSILRFINQLSNMNILNTTQQFLLTPTLTILLVPLLVILLNLMIFEKINIRLNNSCNISIKDKISLNIKLFQLSKLNIRKLNKYGHSVTYHPMWIDDKYQIKEMEIFHMNQEKKYIQSNLKSIKEKKVIIKAFIWGLFIALFNFMSTSNVFLKSLISTEKIVLITYITLVSIFILITFKKTIFQFTNVFIFSSIIWFSCLLTFILFSYIFKSISLETIFKYSLYYYGLTICLTTILTYIQYKISLVKFYRYYSNSVEIYFSSDHLHHINNTTINAAQHLKKALEEDFLILKHVYFKEDITLEENEIKLKIYGKTRKLLKFNEEEIYTNLSKEIKELIKKYRSYFTK